MSAFTHPRFCGGDGLNQVASLRRAKHPQQTKEVFKARSKAVGSICTMQGSNCLAIASFSEEGWRVKCNEKRSCVRRNELFPLAQKNVVRRS